MTKCPACGYEYKGKRKVERKPGQPEICGQCGNQWVPKRGGRRKTDDEFFQESIDFFTEDGESLLSAAPAVVNEYDAHSLLKLIGIHYWTGIFVPIIDHRFSQTV